MRNKYNQKLLESAKKSTTDAMKTALKRAIQKTAEATGDLIDNKTAGKITRISKYPKEVHKSIHKMLQKYCIQKQMRMKQIYQKKDIYLQKKDNKLLMN